MLGAGLLMSPPVAPWGRNELTVDEGTKSGIALMLLAPVAVIPPAADWDYFGW